MLTVIKPIMAPFAYKNVFITDYNNITRRTYSKRIFQFRNHISILWQNSFMLTINLEKLFMSTAKNNN